MKSDASLLSIGALAFGIGLALSAQNATAEDRIKLGWTSYPTDLSVMADALDGGQAAAEALGVDIEIALAAGAVAQANAIDNLLVADIDILAINPEDSNAIGSSVTAANALGVPVIMWIGDNLGAGQTAALISSDEELGGYTIAKWAMEQVEGSGKIGLIQGTKAHQAGLLRENGFERAKAEFPDIEVAAYGEANWMRDRANSLALDMLTREPEISIIIALSDDMAAGAHSAVAATGMSTPVTGYNGSCEVLNSIWNGRVKATLYQGWRDIGSKVVETAVSVHSGDTVEERIIMPTYVVDRPLMEKVLTAGPGDQYSEGLFVDVQRASDGC